MTARTSDIMPARARLGRSPGIALAVILACQLMVGIDFTIVNIALPQMRKALGFSPAGLSWVFDAYALTFGGLLLLGGRAGDIFGRRRMFLAGMALFTLSSLLGGLAVAPWQLVTARALQGTGAALASPSVMALIAATYEDGPRRTRALSLFSLTSSASLALGLIAGGLLTTCASWRWVLFVNVPIGVAVCALAPVCLRETGRRPGRIDVSGAAAGTLGVAGLVFAFIRASEAGWADAASVVSFVLAAVLLAAFVLVERRARQPVLPLGLLGNRNRAAAYTVMLMVGAVMFDVVYFLTQYLQEVLGYSPLKAGLAFLPMTAALLGIVRLMPRLIKRFGTKAALLAGTTILTIAMVWLAQISVASGYALGLLGPLLLTGIGIALTTPSLAVATLAGVSPDEAGAASGVLQTMQWIGGGSLGLAVFVTVFTSASGGFRTQASPAAFTSGISAAFLLGTVFAGLAALTALAVIRGRGTVAFR